MQENVLEGNLKIEIVVAGLRMQFVRRLSEHGHKQNAALTIPKFLLASTVESNISNSYKEDLVTLCKLSNRIGKNFRDFDREDILTFLDSYRKTEPKEMYKMN